MAMHADQDKGPPTALALDRWQEELDFYGTAMMLDFDREVLDDYIDANPGPKYTQAITLIIDKHMRIRRVGSTYENDHQLNLDTIYALMAEE